MEIITPPEFSTTINNCYLLLDTNVFIDAYNNPIKFGAFFNDVKDHGVALVTIEPVILEFLKGAPNLNKYREKLNFLTELIDITIEIPPETYKNSHKLILSYNEEGRGVSITDFLLGGMIMNSHGKLLLMSKNTTDFPTNIFKLETFINLIRRKSIQSYGIYSYQND